MDQGRVNDEGGALTDGLLFQGNPAYDVHGFVKAFVREGEVSP